MTKKEFDERYVSLPDKPKVVVCETHRESMELLKLAHSFGYVWASGNKLIDVNHWRPPHTCYRINKRTITVALESAQRRKYEIVYYRTREEVYLYAD